MLHLTEQKEIWEAIYLLKVRGAPAIGVAAAFGVYLAAKKHQNIHLGGILPPVQAREGLPGFRPAHRRQPVLGAEPHGAGGAGPTKGRRFRNWVELLHQESVAIKDEDVWMCRQIGEYGLSLIKDGDGILTHCNAGQLATSKYGTALAPIHLGR